MASTTSRLARASHNRGNLPRFSSQPGAAQDSAIGGLPRQRHLLRHVRAVRRTLWLLLWIPIACAIQAVLIRLPGREKAAFARLFWAMVSRMLGLSVRVIGRPLRESGRPVIYVCNHSSWLDIPALGGRLNACFVAKGEVGAWPVIGTIARLGRTVFVSRARTGTAREKDDMAARLAAGDDLVLFPEGTSSDGSRVLPFRSPFFAAAYSEAKPLIQPVSVVYDRLAGLPVGHASRPVFAWYGDMSLAPHFWQVAQWRGKRVTLLFHQPLDPADFPDRKALSAATWQAVADGAAALRQNRPARPLPAAAATAGAAPAFA